MVKIKAYESKDILEFIENNEVPYFKIFEEYEFYVQDIKEFLLYFSKKYNKILNYICKQNVIDLKTFIKIEKDLPELNFSYIKDSNSLSSLSFNKYIAFSGYIFGNIDLDKCVSIKKWREVEKFLKELTNDLMFFKHPFDGGETVKKIEESPLKVPENLKEFFIFS